MSQYFRPLHPCFFFFLRDIIRRRSIVWLLMASYKPLVKPLPRRRRCRRRVANNAAQVRETRTAQLQCQLIGALSRIGSASRLPVPSNEAATSTLVSI